MERLNNIPNSSLHLPDDIFRSPNFLERRWLIQQSSRNERLQLWIDTYDISSSTDSLTQAVKEILFETFQIALDESNETFRGFDFLDTEIRSTLIPRIIERYIQESPTEFLFLQENWPHYIVINSISINITREITAVNTDNIRRLYFSIILEDIRNHWEVRYDTEMERQYIISQIWNDETSLRRLYNIFHDYGFTNLPVLISPRPQQRPNNYDWYVSIEHLQNVNHFERLRDEWFSWAETHFLSEDFLPILFWENYEFRQQHIDNIRRFLVFLIDMETGWNPRRNEQWSTATSYTQTLNQTNADRSRWAFNSIDLRLREALRFYNNWNLTPWSRNAILNTSWVVWTEWISRLWEYNQTWRNISEFLFIDEMRMTMIFLARKNPTAMRNLILWWDFETNARHLYHEHHTNSENHTATRDRLWEILPKYL